MSRLVAGIGVGLLVGLELNSGRFHFVLRALVPGLPRHDTFGEVRLGLWLCVVLGLGCLPSGFLSS